MAKNTSSRIKEVVNNIAILASCALVFIGPMIGLGSRVLLWLKTAEWPSYPISRFFGDAPVTKQLGFNKLLVFAWDLPFEVWCFAIGGTIWLIIELDS